MGALASLPVLGGGSGHSPVGVVADGRDAHNMAVMDRVNESGAAFLSHTELDGEVWLRIAIGNIHTMAEHVDAAWASLQQAGEELGEALRLPAPP